MNKVLENRKKAFHNDNPMDKSWGFVKLAIILVIISILIISANSLMEYSEMIQENKRLELEIEKVENHIGELEYRLSAPRNDRNFVALIAKEKLNLVFPEEILFTEPGACGN